MEIKKVHKGTIAFSIHRRKQALEFESIRLNRMPYDIYNTMAGPWENHTPLPLYQILYYYTTFINL